MVYMHVINYKNAYHISTRLW